MHYRAIVLRKRSHSRVSTSTLEIAEKQLLLPTGITEQKLQYVLGTLLSHRIDDADLYFQLAHAESWTLDDSIVKEGSFAIEKGVGVRAVSEDKTGFAYSNDIDLPALERASDAAKGIAQAGKNRSTAIVRPNTGHVLYPSTTPLTSLSNPDKVHLLQKIDTFTRALDSRVTHVMVSLAGSYKVILVMTGNGMLAADIRPLVRMSISVIVEQHEKREQGNSGWGGRGSYLDFFSEENAFYYAREALRQALVNLDAIQAPAGTYPVVLGPGWPGVLLHEAVGHGLEGDFNRKGSSAFSNRIGQRVASPLCTVIDNGTLPAKRGSLNIDDEGTPTQCTTLIEKGILVGYLQDKMNARLMHMKPTGNGRRESFACLPLPRMTNTYLQSGAHQPEDIIKSVQKGIYAVNFSGGQVDITSGKFVFGASEAYLIENGKVTAPIKGATLIGNGPDVLTRVSMVGNDLKLDTGIGSCGKDGQNVPVGVGQPTLKIDSLTIGGTNA